MPGIDLCSQPSRHLRLVRREDCTHQRRVRLAHLSGDQPPTRSVGTSGCWEEAPAQEPASRGELFSASAIWEPGPWQQHHARKWWGTGTNRGPSGLLSFFHASFKAFPFDVPVFISFPSFFCSLKSACAGQSPLWSCHVALVLGLSDLGQLTGGTCRSATGNSWWEKTLSPSGLQFRPS